MINFLKKALYNIKESELAKLKEIVLSASEIIILGNGGSNAIASHIAQDYTKILGKKSFSFSDSSRLTCYINDYGMEEAYVKYLQHFSSKKTLVILISSSGRSKNIINAANFCLQNQIKYIILTGFDETNELRQNFGSKAEIDFWVNSNDYGIVECIHEIILHAITFPPCRVGFIAGCFDVIHPGYAQLFCFAKQHCDYLIVGLHEDATYRENKLKPVLTINERTDILKCIKQIDEIIPYKTENDLLSILRTKKINVRFLGSDYRDRLNQITGLELNIPIVYHERVDGWSATKFKKLIKESV